jgi:hypothetical protein
MTKTLTMVLVCILVSGFTGSGYGQKVSDKEKRIIEQEIDLDFHEMIKAAENLDYDKLNQGVDDRYTAGFIVNGTYFTRYDSLHTVMKSRAQGLTRQSIAIQTEKITVLSDHTVLLTAAGNAKIDISSGQQLNVQFFWSFVFEKIENTWKVIYSHQSGSR